MQTGSSGTLIGWKSGQTTFVPLWDRMEGAWLRTLHIHSACGAKGYNYTPMSIVHTVDYGKGLNLTCTLLVVESKGIHPHVYIVH